MSAGPSGVAEIPKYPRLQMNPPRTGHRLAADATTMAVVTINAGDDVGDVRHSAEHLGGVRGPIDQRADPHPESEQVEQRLDERGEQVADPEPPEEVGVPERHSHRSQGSPSPRLVDQRSTGEVQEHVLEARSSDQRTDRLHSPTVHRSERGLAVVGVDKGSIREHLDPFADAGRIGTEHVGARAPSPFGAKRSSSTSLVEYCSISDRGEPVAAIRPPSITTNRSHNCSASSM